MTRYADARHAYARAMAAASGATDGRIGQAFAEIAREDFLPPGPWTLIGAGELEETPNADAAALYADKLVVIDGDKGINNGEPSLHAAWIGAVAPKSGETVTHIGAGLGYYTAILARLVGPGGKVAAFEIDPALAAKARQNLDRFENVTVHAVDAAASAIPKTDIIYVNAGLAAPPFSWLCALAPGGRLIFPWRPVANVGLAMLVWRTSAGFSCTAISGAWFIPCAGVAHAEEAEKIPDPAAARATASVWLRAQRAPDETATAIYRDIWFSSRPPGR